jgi:hypothetical protein
MARTANRRLVGKKDIEPVELAVLHLDPSNPRFGMMADHLGNERAVLDFIVEQFGVDDVLSSIAVNGYFNSEPVLAKRDSPNGRLTVAEGNRRLVACLILAADPRAKNQAKRTRQFRAIHEHYGAKPYAPVPTIIFETKEEKDDLLPYLGVRHIAGAQQWDSFAKAAWVAQAIENRQLELDDVIHMIGDDSRVARRMLMGYYVVRQLVDTGHFDPANTQKKGTKSNPEFPFSWVYTALGFASISSWLELPSDPKKTPLGKKGLENAGRLFAWMFGQEGVKPAVQESRDISELARAVADPDKLRLLRVGNTVREVARKSRAPVEQVSDGLTNAQEQLGGVLTIIGEGSVNSVNARECVPLSKRVKSLAIRVNRELQSAAGATEDQDA